MEKYYTSEKNTQLLIYLMKKHHVRKIVTSPGATNVCLVGSIQNDPYFELYSCVDERSAAYMACGLAAETGEAVALSCTGATASRNYIPALTEAYYRKLPILAITSTQPTGRIGHNIPQVIDRAVPLNDIVKLSVQIPVIHDLEEQWTCNVLINKALLELTHRGTGPVHINLTTTYSTDYSTKELPDTRVIDRIEYTDNLPELNGQRIAIFVGAHQKWSERLTNSVDLFCEKYNAVVLCDQTSNYRGKFRILANLVSSQLQYRAACRDIDVLIHLGDISGAYIEIFPSQVWRVNPDGAVCDTFRKLRYTFEMNEVDFFEKYNVHAKEVHSNCSYLKEWQTEIERISVKIPNLPFSNIWAAQHTIDLLPENCVLHLGILNSLRSWNFFESKSSINIYSNTGGFGIDGCVSSLLGASLANPAKMFFGVVGDLAFFYDMNVLGNRHFGKNIRLMVVNNGRGTEFRNFDHNAAKFGDEADTYMAAAGHFGKQSVSLIKNYAEDLGFIYLSASNKEEYLNEVERFVTPDMLDQSVVFEVFTDSDDESKALELIRTIESSATYAAKNMAKNILGDSGFKTLKKMIKGKSMN